MADYQLFCVALVMAIITLSNGETVYEALGREKELSMFQEMVDNDEVVRISLQVWPMTVFAPTNQAVASKSGHAGPSTSFASYHVINLLVTKSMFPFSTTSLLSGAPPLYMSIKYSDEPTKQKEYYVNNAKILRSEHFVSNSGNNQTLYVIDEVLQPVKSTFPPTAYDIIQSPEKYGIPDVLKDFKMKVADDPMLKELYSREGTHTYFVPIADSGKDTRDVAFDSWIVQGHVIPKNVLFTRVATELIYPSEAFQDDIKVELSFVKDSNDIEDINATYAQSNTLISKHGHKEGSVLSKIVIGNIPVKNGVVHFVEHPFMVIDTTVWKFLSQEKHSLLSEFMQLVEESPEFKELLMSRQDKTIFAPSNDAIRQLDKDSKDMIRSNITDFLKLHLVMHSILTSDVPEQREVLASDNQTTLYIRVHNYTKEVLTVEGGGVKATAIHPDIGATDGVIHIVDKFLSIPIQTVYQRLQSEHDLRFTNHLVELDQWGFNNLNNKIQKNLTFFAPNDKAWDKIKYELPTAYKQLQMSAFPYHVHKILDRHLMVGKMIYLDELRQLDEIQMLHGKFQVVILPSTDGNSSSDKVVALRWEGLEARIVHSDLQAVNGVIHVIDTAMMKQRDLTKAGGSSRLAGSLCLMVAALALSKFAIAG